MTLDEIRDALRAQDFTTITIERMPAVAVGRDQESVSRQARELADHPRYGADGPSGSRLVTLEEYRALRAAGATDKTPWA